MKTELILLAIVISGVALTVLDHYNNPFALWVGIATFGAMLLPLFDKSVY